MSAGGSNHKEDNYLLESSEKKAEDGMKVCRGPFNVQCTTSKDP